VILGPDFAGVAFLLCTRGRYGDSSSSADEENDDIDIEHHGRKDR